MPSLIDIRMKRGHTGRSEPHQPGAGIADLGDINCRPSSADNRKPLRAHCSFRSNPEDGTGQDIHCDLPGTSLGRLGRMRCAHEVREHSVE